MRAYQTLYVKALPFLLLLITVLYRAPEVPGGGTGR